MPIDLIQWRISIGLFHSEGPYREMKRRRGCNHQKIRIRSIIGNASFVTAIFLLLSELMYIALLKVLDTMQWSVCVKLFWSIATSFPPRELQQSGNKKASFKRISAVLADHLALFVVCLVALLSVVQMLLMLAGDVERNPGPTGIIYDLVDDTRIEEADHHDVMKATLNVAARWNAVGGALGIALAALDRIERKGHSSDDCLSHVLLEWLRLNYDYDRHGMPTWQKLVEVIEDPAGGNDRGLARRIAGDHPKKGGAALPPQSHQPHPQPFYQPAPQQPPSQPHDYYPPPPQRFDVYPPLQRYDVHPLPQRYDAHPLPQRYDAHSPPHRYDVHPPPQRYDVHSPPQHYDVHPPPQRYDAHSPPQHYDVHPPPQHYYAHSPPQHYDVHPPPQHYYAHSPPQHYDAHSPPQHYDVHPPPQHYDAHSPPQHYDVHPPPQHYYAHSPPQHYDAHSPPQHYDVHPPPQHYDVHPPPQHYDVHPPPQHYDAHSPPQHYDVHPPPQPGAILQCMTHTSKGEVSQQLLTSVKKSFPPPHIDPRETHPLCGKFATVYSNITNLLGKSVGLQDLKDFLTFYSHPLYPEQQYVDPKVYKGATTTKDVLTGLCPQFINYLNFGLLEEILKRFNCTDGARLLEEYKGLFSRKRKLQSMPDPLTDEEIEQCHGVKRVRVKVNASTPTLETVENTRNALTDSTGVDPSFIVYASQNPGSVLLDFLVPSSISHIFRELCEEDLTVLANAGIVELNIDDLIICNIQQHSTPKGVIALVRHSMSTRSFNITNLLQERLRDCTMVPEHQNSLLEMAAAVPEENLREVCTDTFLRYCSTQIRKWTDLSFYLHIKDEVVGMIMARYQDTEEQVFQVLQHWKEREGQNATYGELLKCVLFHGEMEKIEWMLRMIAKGPLAVAKTKAILQQRYVSQQATPIIWPDAPALPQFNRSFGSLRVDIWLKWLHDLDYSQHEMIEPSSPIITVVSPKSLLNAISMRVLRLFILKGPHRCGKTMVLGQFVLYWAKGYTLRKYRLVLLVDTSLFHVPPSTLKDLLEPLLGLSVSAEDICSHMEEREGEGVLFILDGVTDHNLAKQGIFHRLTSGQYLRRSTVLMTTTGITSKDWEKEDCTQFELLGLSSTQISQAVINHFSSSEATDFFLYVTSNPDVESILSSPVYLSALLYLFSKIPSDQLPSTWTELFSSLTMLLLKQTFPHRVILSSIRSSSTAIKTLPSEVRSFIERMGSIAFHALRSNTATFELDEQMPSSHFLTTSSTGTTGSPVSEHRYAKFTLPLLQHYLASLWIHNRPPKEKQVLMSDQSRRSLPQVYEFLAGLSDERSLSSLFRFLDNDTLRTVHLIAEAGSMIPDHAVVLRSMTSHINERFMSARSVHALLLCQPFLKESEQLNLEGCYLSDGGVSVISKSLGVPGHSTLTSVILCECTVSDGGAATLATALRINRSLKTLKLSENYISDKGAMAIGHALKDNHSLEELDLWKNSVGDAGAQALAEGLRENSSLRTLILESNKIGDTGAAALGDALKSNRSLEKLNLDGNSVGDAGAQALAEGLRENSSLRTLNLWDNKIGATGAAALGDALKSNRSLEELDLSLNSVGDAGGQALAEGLRENSSLRTLSLWSNKIGYTGVSALGDVLKSNRSLEELNLYRNSVGAAGVQALAEGLRENYSLRTLKLTINHISGDVQNQIWEAVRHKGDFNLRL